MTPRRAAALLALAATLGACGDGSSGPSRAWTIEIHDGNGQLGGFGELLDEPLRVLVSDASTGAPAEGIVVQWSIVTGAGAMLSAAATSTSEAGIASVDLRLGTSDALYRVRATVEHRFGGAPVFEAHAVSPVEMDSITPAQVAAGDTITIHGSAFASVPADNTVLVAGMVATVVDVTPTRLRAVVPACVPTRSADVRVLLGSVESNVVSIGVTGSGDAPIELAPGEALRLEDAAGVSCLRLPAAPGSAYLLVLQNAGTSTNVDMPFRLTAAAAGPIAAPGRGSRFPSRTPAPAGVSAQAGLDGTLRERERLLVAARTPLPTKDASAAPPAPKRVEVGDERDFWVFRSAGNYERVTAVVRHISDHAVLYEDLDAPADGFDPAAFQQFGEIFDDPIYQTMVGVYGAPSDVDGNGRVIILFTPVVNRLTPPGSGNSFVAGFFFGIDLLEDQPRGNDAEIFYTLVPDPDGEFGNPRTFEQMLQTVPPVMAHEFMHMIHFNQRVLLRDVGLDATWLSEGLAHTAEELIGDEYVARGDEQRAFDFKIQNFLRADAYLEDPDAVSPISPIVSLPVRGSAWLLLEYLRGHFGGNDLLAALTRTTAGGVANITGAVGLDWTGILSRWGTANWADDSGVPVDPVHTYTDVDLRAVYADVGFPLRPIELAFGDATDTGSLPASASAYYLIDAGAATAALNVAVAGRSAPFDGSDRPQMTVLRVR